MARFGAPVMPKSLGFWVLGVLGQTLNPKDLGLSASGLNFRVLGVGVSDSSSSGAVNQVLVKMSLKLLLA